MVYTVKPAISIITVCLDCGKTIRDCLHSVKQQSIPVEHIIIDGGSRDASLGIMREFAGDHLQLLSEPDDGIYHAMNKGVHRASGEIVGILNSDDVYAAADVIEAVAAVFEDISIEACYGDLCYVDPDDPTRVRRYWRAGDFHPERFYSGWMPPHPTFFVRRRVYENHGLFNPALGSAADYELMLRFLLKHRVKTAYIPRTLVRMRSGGVSNASLKNRLAANRMDRRAWRVNGLRPHPWTLWMKPLRKLGQWVRRP